MLGAGACATLDMPTPIEHVQTDNETAPSYEYRPPPLPDAAAPPPPHAGMPRTASGDAGAAPMQDAGPRADE